MRRLFVALCLFLFSWTLHGYELSQDQVKFVKNLQIALKSDNRGWISENISYPLKVTTQNGEKIITSKEELLDNFESVFNCDIKKSVKQQDLNNIFNNWQGMMIGNEGQVWITTTVERDDSERSWITAINN